MNNTSDHQKLGVIGSEKTIFRFGIAGIKYCFEVTKDTTEKDIENFINESPASIFITEQKWDVITKKNLIPLKVASFDLDALLSETLGVTLTK